MEENIDLYAHKLSTKSDICYETARSQLESYIDKLEEKNYGGDIIKKAYSLSKKKIMKGGDPFYAKYLKYKNKYLDLKNTMIGGSGTSAINN